MADLETLLKSILSDLIEARRDADRRTAELAEEYRRDAIMSMMPLPALNISNVTVDLKLAFEEPPAPTGDEPQDRPGRAADLLRDRVATIVAARAPGDARPLAEALHVAIRDGAAAARDGTPERVEASVASRIDAVLKRSRIELAEPERRKLGEEVSSVARGVFQPAQKPVSVIVGRAALEKVDASRVSSIRFTVDLSEMWPGVETDEAGG